MIDAKTATMRMKTLIDAVPDDIRVPLEVIVADINERIRSSIRYKLLFTWLWLLKKSGLRRHPR